MELGFEYEYTMEELFDEAIHSCMEKKLIPLKTVEAVVIPENGKLEVIGEQLLATAAIVNGKQLVVTKAIDNGAEEKVPVATH